jgi:hypothetical protein
MAHSRAHQVARKYRRARFIAGILALFAASLLIPGTAAAAGVTYYVDCTAGNDANLGLSQAAAWRSLSKASGAPLLPGDSLLFKRGCSWDGTLTLKRSGTSLAPIRIGAYGSGALPRIQNGTDQVAIFASHLVIQYLHVRANHDSLDAQCNNARIGQKRGFRFFSGAAHNVLEHSLATDLYGGIWLSTGSHHNTVRHNTLRNNNMKVEHPDISDSSGAVGIAVQGDDSVIADNDITGSYVCSRVWGRDGAAIEIYAGQRNRVLRNISRDNHIFTEMGDPRAADNVYAYNLVSTGLAGAKFLTTRGDGTRYGPVYGTKVWNNIVHLTASDTWGVYCYSHCNSAVLSMKNNILWVNGTIGYSDGPFDESHNVFWRGDGRPSVRFTMAASSIKADPQWVAPGSGDYRLRSTSPAINNASNVAVNSGLTTDLAGIKVPQGGAPDRGGYEYAPSALPAPTPTPTPTPPPPTIVGPLASDSFNRVLDNGWGSAATGGRYTLDGASVDFTVDGAGNLRLPAANANRAAMLGSVSVRDVDIRFRVSTNKVPAGGSVYAYGVVRRVGDSAYRPKLILNRDGSVAVHAGVVVNNAERSVAPLVVVPGLRHTAGGHIWLRARITGANPTTIRVKAWAAGQAEPTGWQFTATSSTAAVQQAGGVGLRAYVDATVSNAPIVVTFDDFTVVNP